MGGATKKYIENVSICAQVNGKKFISLIMADAIIVDWVAKQFVLISEFYQYSFLFGLIFNLICYYERPRRIFRNTIFRLGVQIGVDFEDPFVKQK